MTPENYLERFKMIPWWYTEIGETEKAIILSAFENKQFSMGPIVADLENSIAKILDVPYVVVVNSGSSGLIMGLLAIGIRPGDEVIVPAITWIATAQAAAILGARVVLVDCFPNSPIINPKEVKKKVTKKTKAIIPVHLNGRACDLDKLRAFNNTDFIL